MTDGERRRELVKRESLKERERKIYRKLEFIEFRLSVLPKILEKVHRNNKDHYNRNVKLLLAQRSLSSCEQEVLKKMEEKLDKELIAIEKKVRNSKVDALGREKLGGHTPT